MQTILITGSTRGIGKGLAREFLGLGHQVVVTGRSQAAWDSGVARFGRIDMWISNAAVATYGCTKRAIRYFTASLARECAGTPVLVGSLSPGIVTTDLLLYSSRGRDPAEWEQSKRIMKFLGDDVTTVTPWLARDALRNQKQGAMIAWLTRGKSLRRFLAAMFRKRDLMSDLEARPDRVVR